MKRALLILALLLAPSLAGAVYLPVQGGTGSSTLGGILSGNGTAPVQSLTIGTGLQLSGNTLSSTVSGSTFATSSLSAVAPLQYSQSPLAQFSITQAGIATNGYLSSTDWNTFNNKQATLSASWPIILTGTTVAFGGLSTSTVAVTGNIPYFSGVNTFANVATSTLTATAPLTGSFTHIGTTGSLGCQTASGSQAGCLSSTDWTTFNNKQSALTLGAGTVNSSAGNVLYATATSTPTVTSPITYSGTLGSFIGGVSGTFACATCLTANQTITLSGDVSGSGSTAITTTIGSNKVTVGMLAQAAANTVLGNPTGATANVQAFATSSLFAGTAGQAAFFSGTGLLVGTSSALFGANTILLRPTHLQFQDSVPTFTTDIYQDTTNTYINNNAGNISLTPNTNSNSSGVYIRNDGNVGIGTTSPRYKLSLDTGLFIKRPTAANGFAEQADNSGNFKLSYRDDENNAITDNILTSTFGGNIGISTSTQATRFVIQGPDTSKVSSFLVTNSTGAPLFSVLDNGSVAVGTSTPDGLDFLGPNYRTFEVNNLSTGAGGIAALRLLAYNQSFLSFGALGATLNNKLWDELASNAGQLEFRLVNDNYSAATDWMRVNRSGTTVTSVTIPSSVFAVGTLAAATANHVCFDTTTVAGANTLATCSSLRALKTNIQPLAASPDELLKLVPRYFENKKTGAPQYGFIAEEVHAVDPLLSSYYQGTLNGVDYDGMTALLVKNAQAQQKEIDDLKAQLKQLQK